MCETRIITFGAECPEFVGVKSNDILMYWVVVAMMSKISIGDGLLDVIVVTFDSIIVKPGMQYGWRIIVRELDCVST